MKTSQKFHIAINEENTYFKDEITKRFPLCISEEKESDLLEFFIRSSPYSLPEYPVQNIMLIGTDTAREYLRRSEDAQALVFKNKEACLDLLLHLVSEYFFGAFKEFDFYDLTLEFASSSKDMRIIDSADAWDIASIPQGITVFSAATLCHGAIDEAEKWEETVYGRFSENSFSSFIMPQNTISYKKIFYIAEQPKTI